MNIRVLLVKIQSYSLFCNDIAGIESKLVARQMAEGNIATTVEGLLSIGEAYSCCCCSSDVV